jgi:hypothetical protein
MSRLFLFCVCLSVGLFACRDAAREAEQQDRAALDSILRADEALDATLREADEALQTKGDAAAADLLEKTAQPRAQAALDVATTSKVTTPWAIERRNEWIALLEARRAEVGCYATALRGNDVDAKLAALEGQVTLEKKVMDLVNRTKEGPHR